MRHQTNELSFERPEWLLDQTHHLFTVTPQGPSPFNVVLSRSAIDDETLDEVTDRIVRDLGSVLEGFAAKSREALVVGGEPARILQFEWLQNGQRLYQRQAVVVRDGPEGRVLHQIAATASEDARQRHVAGFAQLLASLEFRGSEHDGRDG